MSAIFSLPEDPIERELFLMDRCIENDLYEILEVVAFETTFEEEDRQDLTYFAESVYASAWLGISLWAEKRKEPIDPKELSEFFLRLSHAPSDRRFCPKIPQDIREPK